MYTLQQELILGGVRWREGAPLCKVKRKNHMWREGGCTFVEGGKSPSSVDKGKMLLCGRMEESILGGRRVYLYVRREEKIVCGGSEDPPMWKEGRVDPGHLEDASLGKEERVDPGWDEEIIGGGRMGGRREGGRIRLWKRREEFILCGREDARL